MYMYACIYIYIHVHTHILYISLMQGFWRRVRERPTAEVGGILSHALVWLSGTRSHFK